MSAMSASLKMMMMQFDSSTNFKPQRILFKDRNSGRALLARHLAKLSPLLIPPSLAPLSCPPLDHSAFVSAPLIPHPHRICLENKKTPSVGKEPLLFKTESCLGNTIRQADKTRLYSRVLFCQG